MPCFAQHLCQRYAILLPFSHLSSNSLLLYFSIFRPLWYVFIIRGDIKRGLTWLQSVYIRRFAREQLLFFVTSIHNVTILKVMKWVSLMRLGNGIKPNPPNGIRKSFTWHIDTPGCLYLVEPYSKKDNGGPPDQFEVSWCDVIPFINFKLVASNIYSYIE